MDLTGKIIDDKYKIIKLVGSGGMAKVYKALDIRLDRYVAVKVLKEDYADNEQFVKKFMKEAQAAAKLAHPNIVNVYDVGSSDGINYIVMELMTGPTLNAYLDDKGVLSAQETVDIIYSIALGLRHAHSNKLIHRDIKPHNILMTSSHMPKVADFGIAMAVSSTTMSAEDDGLGSVHYVSPEQAKGGFLDERSDLYSLGIMMYEMLTGELPYDGDSPVAVALMHVQNTVPSPKTVNKRIPDGVAQIVLNLTRKDPADRYQNAKELLDALRKIKSDINCEIEPTYKVEGVPAGAKAKTQKKTKAPKTAAKPAATGKKIPVSKKKRIVFASVAAALLVIMALVLLLLPPKMVKVPRFIGSTPEEAEALAREAGLKLSITKYVNSPDVKEGLVCVQLTEPETEVEVRSEIEVYISTGPKVVEVPDVVGYYENEAKAALKKANFVIKEIIYEFNDSYEKDMVYLQNPSGGTMAAEGTEITLYVSKGKDTVSVPKLLGMSVEEARTLLSQNGLILRRITYDSSSTYSKDLIMKQSPTAYSTVDKNTAVDVVVSIGKETTQTIGVNIGKYTSGDTPETVPVKIELQDLDGDYETVYNENAGKSDNIQISVKGVGERRYRVWVNGVQVYEGTVKF